MRRPEKADSDLVYAVFRYRTRSAHAPAAPDVAVEPEAIAALKGMGAYLRTLKAFQVDAVTTDEDVLDDGQKVQYQGVTKTLPRCRAGSWSTSRATGASGPTSTTERRSRSSPGG